MRTSLTFLAALIGAGILSGCASSLQLGDFKIIPKMDLRHADNSANGYYKLGRYYHASRRTGDAEQAYRRALALDASHVEARNALGILLAENGDIEQAVQLFREATESTPGDSQLFSNLGYALMLAHDLDGAAEALKKATALDPGNVRAWNNYGRVMEALGHKEQASALYAQVQSMSMARTADTQARPRTHIERRPLTEAGVAAIVPGSGGPTPAKPVGNGFRTEIRELGPSTYELRQVRRQTADSVAQAAAQPRIAAAMPAAPAIRQQQPGYISSARLEIRNGNGITGMARMIRALIAGNYRLPIRVTNQSRFDIRTTRIEYAKGQEDAAHALARDLGGQIPLQPRNDLPRDGLRLVLGKDMQNLSALRAQIARRLAAQASRSDAG